MIAVRGRLLLFLALLGCDEATDAVAADSDPGDARVDAGAPVVAAVEVQRSQAVFVLDFSGSMGSEFGHGTRIEATREAVLPLLEAPAPIDFGLVLFSSDVIASVPIAADNGEAITRLLLETGAGGTTNYSAAFGAALRLIEAAPARATQVWFATDGYSTAGDGNGEREAAALWDAGAVILTLNIGAQGAYRSLLQSLSGTPESRGDPSYTFDANDADTFAAVLAEARDAALDHTCHVTLDDGAMPGPSFTLAADGLETPLELVEEDALSNTPGPAVALLDAGPPARYVINWLACRPTLEDGAQILVRWP